jgi:hypothetical protein
MNRKSTLSLTHGAEPFMRSRQLCSHSRNSQHFMEPEGSLACSEEPSIGPYPEPDQSYPHHSILSPKTHFNIVHPPRLGLLSGLFPSIFHTHIIYAFLLSPIPATCPGHLIILDLTYSCFLLLLLPLPLLRSFQWPP